MKTIKKIGNLVKFLPLFTAVFIFSACEEERVVPDSDLPSEAQTFITTHFPGETISEVIRDRDDFKVDYEVFLSNGVALEFSKKGQCKSIQSGTELPDSVIPQVILDYVRTNYSGEYIVQWEKEDNGQEVEISNGLELKFDSNGNFKRIDY